MASLATRRDPTGGAAMWEMTILGDWQDGTSIILPLLSFDTEVAGRAGDWLAPKTHINFTASRGRLGNPFVHAL